MSLEGPHIIETRKEEKGKYPGNPLWFWRDETMDFEPFPVKFLDEFRYCRYIGKIWRASKLIVIQQVGLPDDRGCTPCTSRFKKVRGVRSGRISEPESETASERVFRLQPLRDLEAACKERIANQFANPTF
jgi:hypothetical protein